MKEDKEAKKKFEEKLKEAEELTRREQDVKYMLNILENSNYIHEKSFVIDDTYIRQYGKNEIVIKIEVKV